MHYYISGKILIDLFENDAPTELFMVYVSLCELDRFNCPFCYEDYEDYEIKPEEVEELCKYTSHIKLSLNGDMMLIENDCERGWPVYNNYSLWLLGMYWRNVKYFLRLHASCYKCYADIGFLKMTKKAMSKVLKLSESDVEKLIKELIESRHIVMSKENQYSLIFNWEALQWIKGE